MTKKILAILFLALGISACESAANENDANVNKATPSATAQAATAAPSASPEINASPAQFKPGDKVKVSIGGLTKEASVVSVDEKTGRVTVKIAADNKEMTLPIADVVRQ